MSRSISFFLFFSLFFSLSACLERNNIHHPSGGGTSGDDGGKASTQSPQKDSTTAVSSPSGLTYGDVLPIFMATCQTCHNKYSGVIQPNWLDYDTAKLYKDSIKKRLSERTMPPSGIQLAEPDRQKILDWIEAGALNSAAQITPPITPPVTTPVQPPTQPTDPVPPQTSEDLAVKIFQESCIGCHGPSSVSLRSPVISGLPPGYIYIQLQAFKSKTRLDSLMSGAMESVGASLTDDEMLALANYVSGLSSCAIPDTVIDPAQGSVSEGEIIASDKGCLGCHNPDNAPSFPNLAGQKTLYINQQLRAFRSGDRKNMMMSPIASGLSDSEITNLAAYMNSLRSCQK